MPTHSRGRGRKKYSCGVKRKYGCGVPPPLAAGKRRRTVRRKKPGIQLLKKLGKALGIKKMGAGRPRRKYGCGCGV